MIKNIRVIIQFFLSCTVYTVLRTFQYAFSEINVVCVISFIKNQNLVLGLTT